ncbi:MAG TPA: C4-type zinc ribbon domain-containing protein [Bacteroidales bacterium]|nr:C4-type zinc ribbon domain-containing protein [Bacteroidales bacterium]HOL98046.1 C4-type zinc ribbon domain-containing protein [Bacteroidales bacterium]HUM32422.1 C4-type zinc ribbon domain-containing protein [Bacteroidales bacterium]
MTSKDKKVENVGQSVKEKLKTLYKLQLIDIEIDRIKTLRGELPLGVRDLEDEVAGLETRIQKLKAENENLNSQIKAREIAKREAEALVKKYTEQQNNVRNNREYDALTKEIEFQNLEIELCNKKIKDFKTQIEQKEILLKESIERIEEKKKDLQAKKVELETIIAETKAEEEKLMFQREDVAALIEQRLLYAYNRIRNNVRNKLAVVPIHRDACGGCYNKIPPQRQLDIKSSRKIIPCEYCGRILVDPDILEK